MKGATSLNHSIDAGFNGFNPRTREGCDESDKLIRQAFEVSIHAPVKGATLLVLGGLSAWQCFNPRTREGCDYD